MQCSRKLVSLDCQRIVFEEIVVPPIIFKVELVDRVEVFERMEVVDRVDDLRLLG